MMKTIERIGAAAAATFGPTLQHMNGNYLFCGVVCGLVLARMFSPVPLVVVSSGPVPVSNNKPCTTCGKKADTNTGISSPTPLATNIKK